jgi:hypothetical protein
MRIAVCPLYGHPCIPRTCLLLIHQVVSLLSNAQLLVCWDYPNLTF